MKNIIPFKKDVIFKTNIDEITSISLEHTLNIKDEAIKGEFIINGEYKISDKSTTVEPFEINMPFEIMIDEKYETNRAVIDIDDFYYEIKNDNLLSISIDVLVDKLEEKPLTPELINCEPVRTVIDDDGIKEIIKENDKIEESAKEITPQRVCNENKDEIFKEEKIDEKINSIFNNSSFNEVEYVTYNVAIIRDGDTIETITQKYGVDIEEIKKYNDINNLQLGDKLIIPNVYEKD